jgi:hypothetical protein
MNFNIQTAAMFVFFVFDKNGLVKSCSFHGPTLTGARFASTSEVGTSANVEA